MRQCKDYLEQISAYADDELSLASEIRDLESHLAQCQNCTAFYAFSQEISSVNTGSLVEPPSELTALVMSQVKSESASNSQNRTKSRNLRLVMTRLVPIAASLALVVLVWQFWGGFGQLDYAVMPEEDAVTAPAPAAAPSPEVFVATDEYLWAAEYEAEMEITEVGRRLFDEEDGAPPAFGDGAGTQVALDAPSGYVSHNLQLYLEIEHANIVFGGSDDPSYGALEDEDSHVSQASFIVAITGGLPYFMERFEPDPIGQFAGWDKVFVITTDQARLLLSELAYGAMTSEVLEQDTSNPYAIVLFLS
ncbi:MAG: zf-HC2 domain-containing protein [Oscillospiraceae bacterium]|nr:zf-HC2 domain-containing protein [Oscillospiraceae bacterium]MCL2279205.1 zf-HC2 domain-containing protein [Oscillospiraceae bacterium]